ncbi:MAG: CPBP family intramembrane metalloprotease [Actinomycetota bacterium]|nr:CPBP family intramembrane metalloprotease [Actinomycetota bacterium]
MHAVIGFAVGVVLAVAAGGLAASASGYVAGRGQPLPVAVTIADVTGLWVGLVGAAVLASRSGGSGSLIRDFGLRIAGWWDIAGGVLVGLLSQYLLIPLLYLPFTLSDPHLAHRLSQPAQQDTAGAHGALTVVVLFAFLAIGAPVVEELFFRGLLLRALLGKSHGRRWGPAAAIVVSGLLFALAHFEALQFGGLAAFGVVLGILSWRTGRLGPGIAAHAAFNAAAVVTLFSK